MFEQRELRSRREELIENGVKNLKGARLFPKTSLMTEMQMLSLSLFIGQGKLIPIK
jgi:hypothetical protein